MSLKILMIIGAILAAIGIIVGVLIMINTMKREVQVYFLHRKLPNIDADVEKSGKNIGKAALAFIIIGLIFFVPSFVIIRMPRGNDSITAKNVDGASIGEDVTNQKGTNAQNGGSFSAEEKDTIVIKGKTIQFDENSWDDNNMDDFSRYLDNIEKSRRLNLQDDYAASSIYHKVEELLKGHGIFYESEE